MSYYLRLSSPETYKAFSNSDKTLCGFRRRYWNAAQRVKPGDKLLCYVIKLSRWCGLHEVLEGPFIDERPLYSPQDDPFVVRFRIRTLVWLPLEKAIPIYEDQVWNTLSFTRGRPKGSSQWTGKLRTSLVKIDDADGTFLEDLLREQSRNGVIYPLGGRSPREESESLRIQASLAYIGSQMGMRIWVPRTDRTRVLSLFKGDPSAFLDHLPLGYDETTMRTIEQIDVLWLQGRAIKRAFEVEHTTAIYSGILRMADLLELQPDINIRLHVVAPAARREEVFRELQRPVFSRLAGICTYLSYEGVRTLAEDPHLPHLKESVLDEYAEVVR